MSRVIDWENWIGRRLSLKDLHVFFTVVQLGSMAKAAQRLGVTQPAISKVVADLERALSVRLLDRGRRGVEPTIYGHALLKRGNAAFEELRQGIADIQTLADPTHGELRIGCSEAVSAAILPPILYAFSQRFPRVTLSVNDVPPPIRELSALQDRKCDLILARLDNPISQDPFSNDLNVETLFEDRLVVAASKQSQWARRRQIELSELSDCPWILPAKNTFNYARVVEAFQVRGLAMPRIILMAQSIPLRTYFLVHGEGVATFASSVLRSNAGVVNLKALPIELTTQRSLVAIITLKHRILSSVAERFIEHIRRFTKPTRAS